MGTNDRNRHPRDSRAPRRNSARLEADYRRDMRKAAEERVRARLAEETRSRPSGQSATESRYREDYRERNRGPYDNRTRRDDLHAQQRRRPREMDDRSRAARVDSRRVDGDRSDSRYRSRAHQESRQRPSRTRGEQYPNDRQRTAGARDRQARPNPRFDNERTRYGDDVRPRRHERQPDYGSRIRNPLTSTRAILAVVIVVALLIAATLVVRIASSISQNEPVSPLPAIEEQIAQHVSAYRLPESQIVSRLEDQGVDDTWAKAAATAAQTDYRFMVMAQRSDVLGSDGTEVANKLVKLAVSDPEAVEYVYHYLDRYPQENAERYTDSITQGVIPQIYQWDERWGYIKYSGHAFGCTGCGPTSLAMVYAGLTGKDDMSPADMARLAADGGYETDYDGTINKFFVDIAPSLGLDVIELDVDYDALVGALDSGMPVICNVGPGDFTLTGHFIVITGVNDDGTLSIKDPFSSINSSETWDVNLILNQTVALYAYSETEDDSDEDESDENAEESDDSTADEEADAAEQDGSSADDAAAPEDDNAVEEAAV